ncbi:MAG: TRAP transporter small permease [Pseudomonadota bacterium]
MGYGLRHPTRPVPTGAFMVHKAVQLLARGSAAIGGLILVALIILTTLSIVGRTISKTMHADWAKTWLGVFAQWVIDTGIDEINGTYELTEAGVAFAIFAFLPICQLYGAHATVDVFTSALPSRVVRGIRAFWELVLAAVIILITAQLYQGMLRYLNNGETTLFLQFPVWWAYAASVAAAIIACLTAVYCAFGRVIESATGRAVLPTS